MRTSSARLPPRAVERRRRAVDRIWWHTTSALARRPIALHLEHVCRQIVDLWARRKLARIYKGF